jgi:hypothetical protein
VHEEARDPALGLPGELGFPGPVAAQADLHVAARVDLPVADEAVHGGAVRELDREDLSARVGVRVEVDEADGAVDGRDRADVRLGDRVVAAEHDRKRAGFHHLSDRLLDRAVGAHRVRGQDRRVAVVHHP